MNVKSILPDEKSSVNEEAAGEDVATAESTRRVAGARRVTGSGRKTGERTVKIRTIALTALVAVVAVALGLMGWQLYEKANDISQLHSQAADNAHAEQVALDYATGAAEMDFHDLAPWRGRLTKGTTPELSNRLTQASTSMEQIIAPLQWTSTAKPIAAKVRTESNGMYGVDCFVSVLTKNSQAPNGIQSTATYRLTIDGHKNWTITDIAGIDSMLTPKEGPR
ncbi:hypothetical protein ACIBQ0_30090 [Nocardia nova]|uniref:hypothetical protein n=1 Tax=Nocardia nova TaxID=37330 RepID=UPI0037BA9787